VYEIQVDLGDLIKFVTYTFDDGFLLFSIELPAELISTEAVIVITATETYAWDNT
jgi:hypothetical protein